jgi:ubiquitin thioesterase protein OTUB1
LQEKARVESFNEMMKLAGFDVDFLKDMFDDTWTLFDAIRTSLENNTLDLSLLVNALNEENRSNSIIYHFKMMTSAYMVLHADDFAPFLEISVEEYRRMRIDPILQEIDQIGLQALTTGVIAPAGIAVEVLYLDRSAGDEVTPHEFVPNAAGKPTIRLLYRP